MSLAGIVQLSTFTVDALLPKECAVLKEAAAGACAQAAPDSLADLPALPVPVPTAAQDAELAWQADRLQRQVSALQEEREALAQHLDRMQEALAAVRARGEAAQTGLRWNATDVPQFPSRPRGLDLRLVMKEGKAAVTGECGKQHQ